MSVHHDTTRRGGPPPVVRTGTRAWVLAVALVGWTSFVWAGRLRNALGDPALSDPAPGRPGLLGPVLLASSFLVPAVALAVGLALRWRRDRTWGRAVPVGLLFLAGWTLGVWALRLGDIVLVGDHDLGFVVVHAVLAVVSGALAVGAGTAALRSLRPPR